MSLRNAWREAVERACEDARHRKELTRLGLRFEDHDDLDAAKGMIGALFAVIMIGVTTFFVLF